LIIHVFLCIVIFLGCLFIHLVQTFFSISEIDIVVIIIIIIIIITIINNNNIIFSSSSSFASLMDFSQSALFFNHSSQFLILLLKMFVQSSTICFVVNKYIKLLYKDLLVKILEV